MTGRFAITVRRLLPALAVGAVLGLSALLPAQGLGASSDVGYGYANNCGVKGSGFHDHGKTCPNRPFPGKGKGLAIAVTEGNTSNVTGTSTTTPGNSGSHENGTVSVTSTTTTTSGSGGSTSTHGHGHASGRGRGHSGLVDAG
jgi:hypothetical protein